MLLKKEIISFHYKTPSPWPYWRREGHGSRVVWGAEMVEWNQRKPKDPKFVYLPGQSFKESNKSLKGFFKSDHKSDCCLWDGLLTGDETNGFLFVWNAVTFSSQRRFQPLHLLIWGQMRCDEEQMRRFNSRHLEMTFPNSTAEHFRGGCKSISKKGGKW